MITTQQTVLNMILRQIVEEKTGLAELQKKTKKPGKAKASKPKKAAGAAATTAGGSKKGAVGSGPAKKSGAKKPKARVFSQADKDLVANGVGLLEGYQLERAIDIIKKDTNQEESESGELELDIEQLSPEALAKLYDLVARSGKKPARPEAPRPEPAAGPAEPAPHHLAKSAKPKKHKPMGKAEQERSIEKLREIKAQFQRPGSGSQEPLPSVEGNQPTRENEDSDESEVDSEED